MYVCMYVCMHMNVQYVGMAMFHIHCIFSSSDLQETFYLIKKRCESVEKNVSMKLIRYFF